MPISAGAARELFCRLFRPLSLFGTRRRVWLRRTLLGYTLVSCALFLDLLAAFHAMFGAALGHGVPLHTRVVPLLALLPDRLATLVPALPHVFAMFGAALGHGVPLHTRVVPLLALLPDRFVAFLVALLHRLAHALTVVLSQSGGHDLRSRCHPGPCHPRRAIPGAVPIAVETTVKEVVPGMIAHDIAAQAAVEDHDHTVLLRPMHIRARVPMVMVIVDAARDEKREDRDCQHGNGPLASR